MAGDPITPTSTGDQPFPAGAMTSTQLADNASTGEETFDASPVVARSHWADLVDGKQVTAGEADVQDKAVTADEAEDKGARRARSQRPGR